MWSCLTGCWMYINPNDMRLILSFLLGIAAQVCFGQVDSLVSRQVNSLVTYKDTVNHFELGIPAGWELEDLRLSPIMKLTAHRVKTDTTAYFVEGLSVMVQKARWINLETEFQDQLNAGATGRDPDAKEKGGPVDIDGQPWDWYLVGITDDVPNSHLRFWMYVYLTLKNETVYSFFFSAPDKSFEQYRPLFDRMVRTVRL